VFLKCLTSDKNSFIKKMVFISGILLIIGTGVSDMLLFNENNHPETTKEKILITKKGPKKVINPVKQRLKNTTSYTKDKTGNQLKKTAVAENKLPLLARIIHAEAGSESLRGQVAVGAVLLNRIRSGKFPKTLAANIFKPGEFESVSNGYIWSNPTPVSYRAAHLALLGWDPTYGSLYFFNPAKTISRWIWSRPIRIIIGNHNFAG
jgi:spore germination cell wall hydrolase CwlJ-like protein